jgi:hypothetical protein
MPRDPKPSHKGGNIPVRGSERSAWQKRAQELAEWAMNCLVVRHEVWGGYYLDGNGKTKPTTRPSSQNRGRVLLTGAVVARHFAAAGTADVIGLHSTSTDNTCRWGGLDLDRHGQDDDPQANRRAALHWCQVLARQGFRPLLTASNGRGGYHLLVLFSSPVPADDLFDFLKGLVADHKRFGLAGPPEVFPKQPDVRTTEKKIGNWLRLPGRHHTKDYWSRVWDGKRWLVGHEAIDYLLKHRGNPPNLLSQPHSGTHAMGCWVAGCLNCCKSGCLGCNECSLLSTFSPEIQSAVLDTLPTGPGQRNRRLFDLVQRIKFLPDVELLIEDKQKLVRCWLALAVQARTRDFETNWEDFCVAWTSAKHPPNVLSGVANQIEGESLRDRLASLCRALAARSSRGKFFLSCRMAGRLLKSNKTEVSRQFAVLRLEGAIELVRRGAQRSAGGRASEWRWTGGKSSR